MKRAWLVIFGVIFAVLIAGGWWLLRDTPERAIADGLSRLFAAKSVGALRLDVSWTDPEKRITVGWTALGEANTSNLTRPGFFGAVFLGAGAYGDEQSGDLVVNGTTIALRPTTAPESTWKKFDAVAGDPTRKTFVSLDRNIVLDRSGLGSLRAQGTATSVRGVLPSFVSVVRISGPMQVTSSAGRSYDTVPFALDRVAIEPFLVALARAWKGSTLSAAEIQHLQHYAEELSRGAYRLTIDRASREPAIIDASWPELDAALHVTRQMTVHAEVFALNAATDIALPTPSVDGTSIVFQIPTEQLPTSIGRVTGVAPTGTELTPSVGRSVTDEQRFAQYMDELQRRRRRY